MDETENYPERVRAEMATTIKDLRLISAAMAEDYYRNLGHMPNAITKDWLIARAGEAGEKMIARDLADGLIDEDGADEARRQAAAWLEAARRAPDRVAETERQAVEESLRRKGLL